MSSRSRELSTLTTWHGLQPGLARAEVIALLTPAMREDADDPEDPLWIIIDEWDIDLTLGAGGAQPVRQIEWSDSTLAWHGAPIVQQPLHTVLESFGEDAQAAGWRPREDWKEAEDRWVAAEPEPYTDAMLLRSGTLWLPRLRLGLVLENGRVDRIVWRGVEDMPRDTVAGLTEEQLAISRQPDVAAYLFRATRTSPPPDQGLRTSLTALFVLALAGIGFLALREQRRWQDAPEGVATVVGIDPTGEAAITKPYHVKIELAPGHSRTVALAPGEFYVPPRTVGEQVTVRYQLSSPYAVHGPAHLQDAAFLTFVPWAIGATGIYGVLLVLTGWLHRSRGRLLEKA